MKYSNLLLAALTVTALSFTACGGGGSDDNSGNVGSGNVGNGGNGGTSTTLTGDITSNKTLTADKTWTLDGLVVVKAPATLTIEPGTKIVAEPGDGANTSYLIVDKGAKIEANGTADKHIVFTSKDETAGEGKWGGVVLVGNAAMDDQVEPYEANTAFVAGRNIATDSSGTLKYVDLLNSGITMEKDKEINGLSLVGVGNGTVIDHIFIKDSDDDCVETWGGTVNMSNIEVTGCTDDHFDVDDGWSGTVDGLKITATKSSKGNLGNAGIEQSGNTVATYKNVTITMLENKKEGGIYFKKDGVGGHFENVVVDMKPGTKGGAIFVRGASHENTTFKNVTLKINGVGEYFENHDENSTGAAVAAIFDADASNKRQ